MSRILDNSPVQTEMAVSIFKNPFTNGEHYRSDKTEKKQTGTRRVFVQTETGCVLGMELNRIDNAHTLKRKLHLALNFPIEETSLTFGDTILKNDLSAVRNDSPLLLTRNSFHRSSSTPCLSPAGRDSQQRDIYPIEILCSFSKTKKHLVNEIVEAIKNGVEPIPVHGGLGGAYYFKNRRGENVAIVKPTDEEPFAPNNPNPKGFVGKSLGQPGLKRSVRVGETGFREVAAYLLDYESFANVPSTALVKITHSIFNVNEAVNVKNTRKKNLFTKIASLQEYVPHDFDASDYGTSSFPVSSVHRIGILDVRILNTDRHAGNLLVKKLDGIGRFGQVELIPIDHGLCLPENLEDPYFEWIHWPQSSIPFSDEELEYIKNLDPVRDSEMLRSELPMIREACLRVLILCTIFLKEGATFGLCLAEIGEMMSREFRRGDEEPSELERICIESRTLVFEEIFSPLEENIIDEFQFDIDCEEGGCDYTPKWTSQDFTNTPLHFGLGSVNGRTPLSKFVESIEEEEIEEKGLVNVSSPSKNLSVSKLCTSLKNTGLGPKFSGPKPDYGSVFSSSSGPKEQHLASVSFVKVSDMNEDEWGLFLEKFKELLYPAFEKRKLVTIGQRQRQRLGTSCQF